ncbi:hypothetical protein H0H87_010692 [Tephrocybe sp. NHM501043]|nr:hypothetical protein H0H87_010692 [Tephrocybe sp. NHM501043]
MHSLHRHVRTLSTRVSNRLSRTSVFVDTLAQETNEHAWRILGALRRHPVEFKAAPIVVPDYERWRPAFVHSWSLATAVEEMQEEAVPLWLAFYLLAFRIRTSQDAYPAGLDLAYAHLSSAPQHLQGPLLIFALAGLSRFSLLLPIRRVVDSFLITDLSPHSELYFNLFIQALTITPTQSTETAQAIILLIRRMEARKLELFKETYDLLLNDQLATIHLAHFLRHHSTRHAAVPTTAQLEAYLRIFAKEGATKEATELHSIIGDRAAAHPDPHHEDTLLLGKRRAIGLPIERANKLLLGVRADRTAATEFLQKLLKPKFRPKDKPVFNLRSLNLNKPQLTMIPLTQPTPDIHAFTNALTSLAADQRVLWKEIVDTFERARTVRLLSPTTVTYTVLLRALYERGEWATAIHYWDEFYRSGLRIDRQALGAGIRVFTRAGRPHVAYGLIQQWAYRLNLPKPELEAIEQDGLEDDEELVGMLTISEAAGKPIDTRPAPYRVSLSIITLNDWLVTLNRILRPDLVFATWDALIPVYNVMPDARTLSIILSATRRACRLDETSLQAIVARVKYEIRGTFGGNTPSPAEENVSVNDAQAKLDALLNSPQSQPPHPYSPGLWHGRLPVDHARLLFLQAVFGATPDPEALMDVKPPARALRKKAPSEEGEEGWGGLVVGLPKWRELGVDTWDEPDWRTFMKRRRTMVDTLPTTTVDGRPIWEEEEDKLDENARALATTEAARKESEEWGSYHPSIIPTDKTFFNYILLLGITGRASEIARVLAWMRHLSITPQRSTLGAALVLWGEISGRAVLVERWTRRKKRASALKYTSPTPVAKEEPPWMEGPLGEQARSEIDLAKKEEREKALALVDAPMEYAKLVSWLQEWVPLEMMPGPRSLAMWTQNIERFRDGSQDVREVEEAIRQTENEEEG